MIRNENELKQAVERLGIDARPRPEHQDALRRQMLETFEQATFQEPPRSARSTTWLRRVIMNRRFQQAAIAAAILIAVLYGLGWWGSSRGVAYADIVRAIESLQGARFTITSTGTAADAGTTRFAILGDRMRQEMADGSICIMDFTAGTFLVLMPREKQALLATSTGLPESMRQGAQNWLAELRHDLVAGATGAKSLGARPIDGRDAWGFRVTSPDETTNVWVDRRTNLPMRVEITPSVPGPTVVMSDFDFDTPVDESLVSLTPPQGYALLQANVDAASAGEQDAIELLRAYAEANGDRFPAKLELTSGRIGTVMQTLGPKKGWQWSMSMTGTITRAMTFLHMVKDTRYVGGDVPLGDAGRPVFCYKAAGSLNYRVIYGDLSAREVRPEDLPASPSPR